MKSLLAKALEDPAKAAYIRRCLEARVVTPEGAPLPLAHQGNPVVFVVRPFWSVEDGKRHNGVFDPEGHQADAAFLVSNATFD